MESKIAFLCYAFLFSLVLVRFSSAAVIARDFSSFEEFNGALMSSSEENYSLFSDDSPVSQFHINKPSSYRKKPNWYLRFRHRN